MKASIIIPVWNGAGVIADCLDTLRQNAGDSLLEVICVDNASTDKSASIIQNQHDWVKLISQPVNLGFSGGINTGVQASRGDVVVLLNQDCLVMPGWLDELIDALDAHPQVGILGSTIYHADGTTNHSGAVIQRPEASGVHLTDLPAEKVRMADFVTGAAMAIRRDAWNKIGPLDDAFYPAYFEDADYCYRARHKGYEVACATSAAVRHLFSSREWQSDYYRHAVYTNTSRYRFVCKHFQPNELSDFFQAEQAAIEKTNYLNEAIGRLIAARHTLRFFRDVLESRQRDLEDQLPASARRQLQVGFSQINRQAFQAAKRLLKIPESAENSVTGNDIGSVEVSFLDQLYKNAQAVNDLKKRELTLTGNLYFRPNSYFSALEEPPAEGTLQRLYRGLFKRFPGLIFGRDERIMREIYLIRSSQIDEIEKQIIQAGQWANLLELLSFYDDYYQ